MGDARRRSGTTVAMALAVGALVVAPAATALGDRSGRAEAAADAVDRLTATVEKKHDHSTHEHQKVSTENSVAAAAQNAVNDGADLDLAPTLPTGFADVEAIGHISEATAVAFAADGTAFVALKTGIIKSFDYNTANGTFEDWTQATNFADLTVNVDNYWDRGLTGIALDPQFGTAGHNFVYVNYTYNRDPRDDPPVVPKWGTPGQQYDDCSQPATTNPPRAGCVVMMRVTRLTAEKHAAGWEMTGPEQELLASGCFQFGSHASGDVAFGPDGKLYASAGEGASFDTLDHGQYANPCADPANEGGSLRSQDFRSAGDPLGVDGSVVKMDPATGFTPAQDTADSWLVAYGQRNPWRLTFRPGTNELWSGDVGASNWEEVNRVPDVTQMSPPVNRGWPCYEGSYTGSLVQPGWDALDKPLCESLYAQGASAVTAPYFSYETRGPLLTPGEDCQNDTSSVSGVAFGSAASNYPAAYKGAMFFSDYARSCVWVLGKKPNGDPDPTVIQPFVQAAETPVDLLTGPGGDLYYVDYGLNEEGVPTENAAGVHRIVYTGSNAAPTARIVANPASGPAPLTVSFDATTSTDPDADALTYSWDLDGNGSYETSGATPSRTYPLGTHTVSLKVDDGHGHTSTATQQIQAGNTAPVLGTVTPAGSLTWSVGQTVNFAASAADQQQGSMPASAFTWNLAIRHCPNGICHTHNLSTFPGLSSGSFQAPDHEYPSHLLLTVTVTDSGGLTDSETVQLDPKTVALSFASAPGGATVTVNGADHATPYSETFIQGSQLTVTAAPTRTSGGETFAFQQWSDGGARSHELSAPATATTYLATYTRPTVTLTASPMSGPAPFRPTFRTTATGEAGTTFVHDWDLDADGQFDDGHGTVVRRRIFEAVGPHVVAVRITDSRGATDTDSVTVDATNTAPSLQNLDIEPGGLWSVRELITFGATATDAQETLTPSAFSFVLQRQDCQQGCPLKPYKEWHGVAGGTFRPPQMPYPSRLFLTAFVTDAQGLTDSRRVRLDPQPVSLTVGTSVAGLSVLVDGDWHADEWTGQFVAGRRVPVNAPLTQTLSGVRFGFVRWSDGGERAHHVQLGDAPLGLEAVYQQLS